MLSCVSISASDRTPPDPIRDPRFQRRRKVVERSVKFRDPKNKLLIPAVFEDFHRVIGRIGRGEALMRRHYRARIDDPNSPDELLTRYGIKHLHLVRQNSDIILYCIEYRQMVLLLQISDHIHLDAIPPGRDLVPAFEEELVRLALFQKLGQAIRSLGVLMGVPRKK